MTKSKAICMVVRRGLLHDNEERQIDSEFLANQIQSYQVAKIYKPSIPNSIKAQPPKLYHLDCTNLINGWWALVRTKYLELTKYVIVPAGKNNFSYDSAKS